MVLNQQLFNVVDVEPFINYYDSIGVYRTETMNKADPGKAQRWIDPVLRKHFPFLGDFVGGNFYKHKQPYHPHTDHQKQWGETSVNVVVPLWFAGTQPYLVVFNQRWETTSTWTMTLGVRQGEISSSTNKQLVGVPSDYPILNNTGVDIDEEFHSKYLSFPRECYHGLSGEAFYFTPRSVILFDNSKIHCTSKFVGEKLGLSLRYKLK